MNEPDFNPEIVEVFRHALMKKHADDWDMNTVAEAAYICAQAINAHFGLSQKVVADTYAIMDKVDRLAWLMVLAKDPLTVAKEIRRVVRLYGEQKHNEGLEDGVELIKIGLRPEVAAIRKEFTELKKEIEHNTAKRRELYDQLKAEFEPDTESEDSRI